MSRPELEAKLKKLETNVVNGESIGMEVKTIDHIEDYLDLPLIFLINHNPFYHKILLLFTNLKIS